MDESLRMVRCRECGAAIVWIRTAKGRMMPCNANPVRYFSDESSGAKVMDRGSGKLVGARFHPDGDRWGYEPHFFYCEQKAAAKPTPKPTPKPEPKPEPKVEATYTPAGEQLSMFPPLSRRPV